VELDSYHGLLVLKEVSRADSDVYECHSLDLDAVNHDEVVDTLQLTVHCEFCFNFTHPDFETRNKLSPKYYHPLQLVS